MNVLGRAIARKLQFSSHSSSRKCIAILQNHSSLYSTSTWYTAKNPKPVQQPPPSKSYAEMAQKQTQVPQREIEIAIDTQQGLKNREQQVSSTGWRRPSEIPWQPKVANSVNLIGHVQIPVQFETSPDGKNWAGTLISQQDTNSSDSPPFWIPVIFEGDLAHIAACHLKAKDCVYIAGQLSADPPPFTMSQGQANVQVMVRSLNIVKGFPQTKKALTPLDLERDNSGAVNMKNEVYVNQLWKDLFAKPHEWWDIRLKKGNSLAAAFENKDNGQLLWINESTPECIQKKLESLAFDRKIILENLKSDSDVKKDEGDPALDYWRDLLRNPQKWLDYRERKLNGSVKPKHPDFKHRDGGHALWLNSAPKWVLSELGGLESGSQLTEVKQTKESQGDDSWKDLVENPDNWWDNRGNKINNKSPDFKHKVKGDALWLRASPSWVASRLPPLRKTATYDKRSKPLSQTV